MSSFINPFKLRLYVLYLYYQFSYPKTMFMWASRWDETGNDGYVQKILEIRSVTMLLLFGSNILSPSLICSITCILRTVLHLQVINVGSKITGLLFNSREPFLKTCPSTEFSLGHEIFYFKTLNVKVY